MIGQYGQAAKELISKAGNLTKEQQQELLDSATCLDQEIETNKELSEYISDLAVIAKHHLPHITNAEKRKKYIDLFTRYVEQEVVMLMFNNIRKNT